MTAAACSWCVVGAGRGGGDVPVAPTSLTGDAVTDELVPVAVQLVGAVRDADRDGVARALQLAEHVAGGRCDPLSALAVVLAALVPYDARPSELLSWWGYRAEYMRLRARGVDEATAHELTRREGVA